MQEKITNFLNQFANRKLKVQGVVCIGDSNQIKSSFQEINSTILYERYDNPEDVLEFAYSLYKQPLPYDKKSSQSKLFIQQGNKENKNIPKHFFKSFKGKKTDSLSIIIISGLDDYIEVLRDFFGIINSVIKELAKKKIPIAILLQFKSQNSYDTVKNLLNLDIIKFEDVFASKIVDAPKKTQIPKKTKSPPKTLETTTDTNLDERNKVPVDKSISDRITKANAIFIEPDFPREKYDVIEIENSVNLFKSYTQIVQEEIVSEEPVNSNLIQKMENLIIFSANEINKHQLIEPLEKILQSLFSKGASKIGTIVPISKMIFKMLKVTGDKRGRYDFCKKTAETLISLEQISYGMEFYSLSLAMSRSVEDAEIIAKQYLNLADNNTESPFLEKTYLYRAIASAYISQNNTIIDQIINKTKKFQSSNVPFF